MPQQHIMMMKQNAHCCVPITVDPLVGHLTTLLHAPAPHQEDSQSIQDMVFKIHMPVTVGQRLRQHTAGRMSSTALPPRKIPRRLSACQPAPTHRMNAAKRAPQRPGVDGRCRLEMPAG